MVRIAKTHLEHLQSPFSLPRGSFLVTNGHFYFFGRLSCSRFQSKAVPHDFEILLSGEHAAIFFTLNNWQFLLSPELSSCSSEVENFVLCWLGQSPQLSEIVPLS